MYALSCSFEFREDGCVTLDLVFLEQQADPGDIGGRVAEIFLHSALCGAQQAWILEPLAETALGLVDDRDETVLHAGVLPQPDEHGRAACGRDLIVEQTLHAVVDQTGDIVILEEGIEVGVVGSDVAVGGRRSGSEGPV